VVFVFRRPHFFSFTRWAKRANAIRPYQMVLSIDMPRQIPNPP
jgi:hypothetical protein